MEATIYIENRIEELGILASKIEELAENWDLPMALSMNINLVLEEAVSNIIFYAYSDQEPHTIEIKLEISNSELTMIIKDNGREYDPTLNELPDITLSANERPVGGLGVFLIRKIMNQVSYQRENNTNVLTLKKKIEQ